MTTSPERYRKLERHERWKIAGWVAGAFVAALMLGGMGAVLQQVSTQTAETATVVKGHNAELSHIQALAVAIHRQQEADTGDRQQLAADVAQVAGYATTLANQVTSNHDVAVANQRAICASLNTIATSLGIHTSCSIESSAP